VHNLYTGADPGFQVRGDAFKIIAPSGGRRENFWGISFEKSRFYAPPGSAPAYVQNVNLPITCPSKIHTLMFDTLPLFLNIMKF
jgi:hypothetical protein